MNKRTDDKMLNQQGENPLAFFLPVGSFSQEGQRAVKSSPTGKLFGGV